MGPWITPVAVVSVACLLILAQRCESKLDPASGSCTLDAQAAIISCKGGLTPTLALLNKQSPSPAAGGESAPLFSRTQRTDWHGAIQELWNTARVDVLMEDIDFNEHGWLQQLTQVALGLGVGEPDRHVNLTLTNCRLVLKRNRLDLGSVSLPDGVRYTLDFRNCTATLNRIVLRGRLFASGKFALDLATSNSTAISHNRVLIEKDSAVGPFHQWRPHVNVGKAYVEDNLVVFGWVSHHPVRGGAVPTTLLILLGLLVTLLVPFGLRRSFNASGPPFRAPISIALPHIKTSPFQEHRTGLGPPV